MPNVQANRSFIRILRPSAPLVLVVTRSELLGTLIQSHWGNRCFRQEQLGLLMSKAGLTQVQFFSLPFGLARFTNIACVGFREK